MQVGLYSIALDRPVDFILYDVTRKPTIAPKRILKADATRMRGDLVKHGAAEYYREIFERNEVEFALHEGQETVGMYGARLTADIGDRPEYYFARREVHRTHDDYAALLSDVSAQLELLSLAEAHESFPRNPDSCNAFGLCAFFGLCSNNVRPSQGEAVPEGYVRREKLHPELNS